MANNLIEYKDIENSIPADLRETIKELYVPADAVTFAAEFPKIIKKATTIVENKEIIDLVEAEIEKLGAPQALLNVLEDEGVSTGLIADLFDIPQHKKYQVRKLVVDLESAEKFLEGGSGRKAKMTYIKFEAETDLDKLTKVDLLEFLKEHEYKPYTYKPKNKAVAEDADVEAVDED